MIVRSMISTIGVIAIFFGLSALSFADAQSIKPVPLAETVDANGVSLLAPNASFPDPSVGIGNRSSGGLYFQRSRRMDAHGFNFGATSFFPHSSWVGSNLFGYISGRLSMGPEVALIGGASHVSGDGGASLTTVAGKYVFTTSNGTKATYDPALNNSFPLWGADPIVGIPDDPMILYGWITKLEKPDGEVITWNYVDVISQAGAGIHGFRLQSVTNNLGYQIHFKYRRDDLPDATYMQDFMELEKVVAFDNTLNPCSVTALSCSDSTGANWPYLLYGGASATTRTVTDRTGNVTTYLYSGTPTTSDSFSLVGIRSPASPTANDITLSHTANTNTYPVIGSVSLTVNGATWNYVYDSTNNGWFARTTVTGPNGYSRVVIRGVGTSAPNEITSDTLNGYQISYLYNTYSFASYFPPGKLTKVTYPDGRFKEFTYDLRRNVTEVRDVATPGSGLADIYTYATYPEVANAVCANAKTCNKPIWVTLPGAASANPSSLPKTDFTYDAGHGGLLTATEPAPGSGPYAAIRPQTRNTYAAVGGVTRVATVKSCRTTATCAGTADETVVETTYNAKRLPSLIVTRAGNNTTAFSATNTRVATTYTPQGDVESVDGPLSGAADTAWTFYDTMRRPRVMVAPDPDGAGTLVYRASRTTYDADGQPTLAEQGSVSSPANCSAANNFCATTMTVLAKSTVEYDAFGRKTRENLINVSTGSPEAVKQYSYDAAGRVECVATRMNSAVYGSLPSACTPSTAGSFGADPILRTTYTVNGDPLVIQSGYGTSLVRNERTFSYVAPGQVSTLKDAANNLTTYAYDGFNRLNKLSYPNTSVGAGTSSATDYEAYTYDAASNKISERRRDGLMIANTYDALNRLRLIDKPGVELDVTNSYDNFDHLITASQTGSSVTWAYDPLGRVTSEAQGLGTVSYTYDTASRRTQLTYPGTGFFANYQYFDDGKLKLIGLNGATTGTGVLATYYDDQLGRRTSMCRGTGTTSSCASVARTTYSYDAASRLSGLAHDLITGASANDASWTLAYSPASQLTSRTATSALYEWPYTGTFTDAYAVNGLNQYTTVAGASLAYDGRGNTTNDTTKTYTYDSSNMLMSASNGAALTYDPTGRLLSIAQGGVTTKFLYDGTRLIAEYNGSNALLRRYVHGDGVDDPIVWYDSSGTTNKRNLFKDERGSVVAADTGAAVTSLKYDEYGNPSVTGTFVPRFQYTGQAWLPEIGLYHYKARIYNPDLGRFMQIDPIGTNDQMNLYAYVGNDPSNMTDPSGLMGAEVVVSGFRDLGPSGQTIDCSWGGCDSMLSRIGTMPLGFGSLGASAIPELTFWGKPSGGGRKGGQRKGERNKAAKPSGTDNEDKKYKPLKGRPGWRTFTDPHTGKSKDVPWPQDPRNGGDGSGVHEGSLGSIANPGSNNSNSESNDGDWLIVGGATLGTAAFVTCVVVEPCGGFLFGAGAVTALAVAH